MTEHLTQQQINQTAWAACDTFRGVVDAGQYKDYILVMLFLRYISDLWNDHLEPTVPSSATTRRASAAGWSVSASSCPRGRASTSCMSSATRPISVNSSILPLRILRTPTAPSSKACSATSTSTREANLGRVKDRNRRLKNLLEDFAKPSLDLRPSRVTGDIIGECYIYLISRFASDAGKKAGEFYTPAAVSRLLAGLAAPQPGNTICDPACGSGSLLIRAAEQVGSDNFALYGQEVNGATWALARMNMFCTPRTPPASSGATPSTARR